MSKFQDREVGKEFKPGFLICHLCACKERVKHQVQLFLASGYKMVNSQMFIEFHCVEEAWTKELCDAPFSCHPHPKTISVLTSTSSSPCASRSHFKLSQLWAETSSW